MIASYLRNLGHRLGCSYESRFYKFASSAVPFEINQKKNVLCRSVHVDIHLGHQFAPFILKPRKLYCTKTLTTKMSTKRKVNENEDGEIVEKSNPYKKNKSNMQNGKDKAKSLGALAAESPGKVDMSGWSKKKRAKFLKLSANQQVNVLAQRELVTFNKNKDFNGALEWYKKSKTSGIKLGAALISNLLKVFSDGGKAFLPHMDELLEVMETNKAWLESSYTLSVRAYAEFGFPEKSEEVMKRMRKAGFEPRLRTFSPVLQSFCEPAENYEGMLRIYDDLQKTLGENNLEITQTEYTFVLKALSKFRETEDDKEKLEKLFRRVLADSANEIGIPDKAYQDAVAKWYKGDKSWKVTEDCEVTEDGICSGCSSQLHSLELSRAQVSAFMVQIETIVRENTKGKDDNGSRWDKFKNWLDRREQRRGDKGAYDVVIDAANIAYYKQNYKAGRFRFQLIDAIISYVESKNLRWLLIIHGSHMGSRDCRTQKDRQLKEKWMRGGNMYVVPSGFNDDWFWLYATLRRGGNTYLISNDVMRDHHFNMLSQKTFQCWRDRHQVGFRAFWDKRSETVTGTSVDKHAMYSHRTQLEFEKMPEERQRRIRVKEGEYLSEKEIFHVHSPICTTGLVTSYQRGKQLAITAEKPQAKDLRWLCCKKI